MEGTDVVKKVNEISPGIILAVGVDALSIAKTINNIPVVYLMVLDPKSVLGKEKNITGVSMYIPYEKQLMTLMEALPGTQTIGLLYDPDKTGHFVESASHFARQMGIELIAKAIHNTKEAPSAIMELKGKIDVFWMLPDVTVISTETVEFLLLFSIENTIPIFTFSEKYVQMGAFMSMDIDAFDMGKQAGEMVQSAQGGKDLINIPPVYARKAVVSTNLIVAKKIGISLVKAMYSEAAAHQRVFRETRLIN